MNFSFFEFALKFLFAVKRKVIKEEGIGRKCFRKTKEKIIKKRMPR